jgi:hypothetical protein
MGVAVVGWLVWILAGSVVPTWLYAASGRSILVVALWHTVFNFTSGTGAMTGPPAVTSTAVIVLAVLLMRYRRGTRGVAAADREPAGAWRPPTTLP